MVKLRLQDYKALQNMEAGWRGIVALFKHKVHSNLSVCLLSYYFKFCYRLVRLRLFDTNIYISDIFTFMKMNGLCKIDWKTQNDHTNLSWHSRDKIAGKHAPFDFSITKLEATQPRI